MQIKKACGLRPRPRTLNTELKVMLPGIDCLFINVFDLDRVKSFFRLIDENSWFPQFMFHGNKVSPLS